MKQYALDGEKGETSLFGGIRVMKDSPRVEAYGNVDELNSVIGVARSYIKDDEINSLLERIQKQLFILGADLASQTGDKLNAPQIDESLIKFIEQSNEKFDQKLERLNNFILPSGVTAAAYLHTARTVCRRVERYTVNLSTKESMNKKCILYLNRLSDLLFTLARYVNKLENKSDEIWKY